MNGESPLEEAWREVERLFGYPPGAFDPASSFFRDMERINRALGEGFTLMQSAIGPKALEERIEALHPDYILRRIFELPRKGWEIPAPWPNKHRRRE